MNKALSLRFKWWLCVFTVTILYAALIYLIGRWPAAGVWYVWAGQYMFTIVAAFIWLCILEWALLRLRFYEYLHAWRKRGILFDIGAALLLMVLCLVAAQGAMPFASSFLNQIAEQLEPSDRQHLYRGYYGLIATQTLCGFFVFLSRQITEYVQTVEVNTTHLEKENLLAQFNALKSQVNPHFLFNSLSILSSLVRRDPELSERFIERLAQAYRYILEQKDEELAPLYTELDFLKAYNFLLQTRFEHKFEVRIELSESTRQTAQIAPLTLQLLVENAVKHNRMSEKEPLIVHIEQSGTYLVVRNALRPRGEQVHSTGVGLQNIINRYALLCDTPVWAGEQAGDFVVRIPLL